MVFTSLGALTYQSLFKVLDLKRREKIVAWTDVLATPPFVELSIGGGLRVSFLIFPPYSYSKRLPDLEAWQGVR